MKTYYFLLLFLVITLLSCEKDKQDEELSKNPPETPEAISYDLNNDAVNDIKVYYSSFTWDGFNCSGDGISGLIETLNDNAVLMQQNEYRLFNQFKDTLRINAAGPYYWEEYIRLALVSITNSSVNGYLWPKEWSIQSKPIQDSYYLGIIIKENNTPLIGWLKLKLDQSSGSIKIVDKKFTSENFIVIDR
jgi:hypothetical protein